MNDSLSILELPLIVTLLFERTHRPLLPGAQGPLGLFVRYLRRKPARGLAVIYSVDEVKRIGGGGHANDPNRSVSLTLDEKALDGAHIRFSAADAQQAPLEVQPSGVLRAEDLGLSVQAFPADSSLPALAASCDTTQDSLLFQALQSAARMQLGDETWRLVSASAVPVRYKPANRCVIRYHLTLEHSVGEAPLRKNLVLFGKVYADPEQARTVQAMQQQLYDEQVSTLGRHLANDAEPRQLANDASHLPFGSGKLQGVRASTASQSGEVQGSTQGSYLAGQVQDVPLLPHPLGMIDALGLTFNEAVQPANPEESLRTGTRALRPQILRGRGGEITDVVTPTEELRLTGTVLARLHTSKVRPHESAPRTGAKEAKRARERASLIAAHNPAQADEVRRLAQELATRLEALQPDAYRPAHGGFKASQLLFHSHHVFVVDFDGFCLADPALDVGYFLAYLRPSGLWYQRSGMRQWFEDAANVFVNTYRQAMLERGIAEMTIDGILERSRLYEAALLFKIATRRANRLNSPRAKELSAMLSEIATCL